jgi:GIY-YIG catalytic domain
MHVLYRFYDRSDHLLYVGITNNPAARFKQHEHGKDWWNQVASITLEQHASRQALMDAERAAIIAERPAHNVVHNVSCAKPRAATRLSRRQRPQLRIGDFVAVGMKSGDCPVGEVVDLDDLWVGLRLKDFITGHYWGVTKLIPPGEILQIEFAQQGPDGVVEDRHLAHFQTFWERRGAHR